jgi:diguanylate cyclase (GGDEF)-like protein
VLNAVRMSRPSASTWWLKRQPVAVRRYFGAVVVIALLLTATALSLTRHLTHFNFIGTAVMCGLAVGVSVMTRSVMVAFPRDRAVQDIGGVWMMSALLIWGPPEALVVAVLVGGVWTQFVDIYWGGSHRQPAQQVFNVSAMFIAIDLAYLVMHAIGPLPHDLTSIAGVLTYLVSNAAVVLGIARITGADDIGEVLRSWSTRVMMLTEATLSVGMAAAWRTEPVAACLLSGTLVAAGAGLHYAHLLEEASTDRRTGLLRPDSWTKTVARLVSRESVGVILADLDHFKQVNDELGHLAGDEVLTAIGATIAESLRPGDVAGRWGGEEFVVALPGLGPNDAREVAERLADAVRTASHAVLGREITCTISAGVSHAQLAPPEDSATAVRQALREADMAMYAAKRAGRDRVVSFADLTSRELDVINRPADEPRPREPMDATPSMDTPLPGIVDIPDRPAPAAESKSGKTQR